MSIKLIVRHFDNVATMSLVNDTFEWRTAQSKLPCLLKYSVGICGVYTSNNDFFLVVELIGSVSYQKTSLI